VSFEGKIDIATVLKKLNDTYDEQTMEEKYFGIAFIDRNGLKHTRECRKSVKSPQLKQSRHDSRGRAEINLKRNGIIMLRDVNQDHPITPKVCMIYGFRDHKTAEWLRVYH
jgi:hypothetical protein